MHRVTSLMQQRAVTLKNRDDKFSSSENFGKKL